MTDPIPLPATPATPAPAPEPARAPDPATRCDDRRASREERFSRRAARHGWHVVRRSPRRRLAHALSWGGTLVVVGVVWLMQGEGWFLPPTLWRVVLPALFAWSGLVTVIVERDTRGVVDGLQRLAIGAWLYVVFNEIWGYTLMQTWPVVLVVIGVATLARGLFDRGENAEPSSTQRREESAR